MINHNKKCNNLTGKEWLQNSFSIWRELTKTKEEKEIMRYLVDNNEYL